MKLLLDQGLPRSAAAQLRALGHDAVHVGELGMSGATDEAILAAATRDSRVVVTLDADFHALLALSHATTPSVVRLREEGLKAPEVVALLVHLIDACQVALETGCVVTVLAGKARLRRLPLIPRND